MIEKINLQPFDYYSQRNNKWDDENTLIHESLVACMPTCRAMFYIGNGIKYFNESTWEDDDYFMMILRTRDAYEYRNANYPELRSYPPNEIHGMYGNFLDEKVCGCKTSRFVTDLTFEEYMDRMKQGQVIMTSGIFNGMHHATTVIGHRDDSLVLADPYGDPWKGFNGSENGYGVEMTKEQFVNHIKPVKEELKWGHIPIRRA